MKTSIRTLALAMALSIVLPAAAQEKPSQQPTSAEWLARIQADKKGIVARSMDLTPEEAKKFWPLYEDFQRELAVPQKALTRVLLDYIAADHSLTDANAKRLADEMLMASKEEVRLHEKYFRKLVRAVPPRKAARYLQIENKIQAIVRYESARTIPLAQ